MSPIKYFQQRKMVLISVVIVLVFSAYPTWGALPKFSWDTLPVFFHSSNSSGQYNEKALQTIAKFQMATIEKWMGYYVQGIDDEDEMVMAMIAIKKMNPKISTYFYMNSYRDRPEMTRMAREAEQHKFFLLDATGTPVKYNEHGYNVFDLSRPEVRQWWLNICLNATKFANGDGCFCDMSADEHISFVPSVPAPRKKAWGDGMLSLTRDVQEALGNDKLLIGKVADQPYVKSVQIEFFAANNDSINSLMIGANVGQVMQTHVPITVPCSSDLTDYVAAFLIGAGKYSYFGCGSWSAEGNDTLPLTWRPEYDKPLGAPMGPAEYNSGMWTRVFASGTQATFDTKTNKGTIKWA